MPDLSLNSMVMVFALINSVILLSISAVHVYWASGGRSGVNAAVPYQNEAPVFVPGTVATLVVAILLALAGCFYLNKIFLLEIALPTWIDLYGAWFLGVVFLLRAIGEFRYVGFFKTVKNSLFANLDTRFYSPLCSLLAFNSFMVAIYY